MAIPFYPDQVDFSIIPNMQGEWDFRKVYIAGSLVSYNGKLYEAQTLVDQSQDAVQLRHDDFHRADTADGWGTDADGNVWDVNFEFFSELFSIQSNVGVTHATGAFDVGQVVWGDDLGFSNVELFVRFSVTASTNNAITYTFRVDNIFDANSVRFQTQLSDTYSFQSDTISEQTELGGDTIAFIVDNNSGPFPLTTDRDYSLRALLSGRAYGIKFWKSSDQEPDKFTIVNSINDLPNDNFFIVEVGASGGTQYFKEMAIVSIPDAPDVNTTDWLLIG